MALLKSVVVYVPVGGSTKPFCYSTNKHAPSNHARVNDIYFQGSDLFIKVNNKESLTYIGLPFCFEVVKVPDEQEDPN